MAYNSRYTRGYDLDEEPINHHENSDDEGDLGDAHVDNEIPMRSGMSPFGNTAYPGHNLDDDDTCYDEPMDYNAMTAEKLREFRSHSPYDQSEKHYTKSISPLPQYGFLDHDPHEMSSTPYSHAESDPEAGFRERQQPLRRGHTRKVKLVNGDIFCTDYPYVLTPRLSV